MSGAHTQSRLRNECSCMYHYTPSRRKKSFVIALSSADSMTIKIWKEMSTFFTLLFKSVSGWCHLDILGGAINKAFYIH